MASEVRFKVTLSIPLNPDNRLAIVEWVGDGERASEGLTSKQLDEYTDRSQHIFYILLTPGHYSIRGRLLQSGGREHVTPTETVEIVGFGPSGP